MFAVSGMALVHSYIIVLCTILLPLPFISGYNKTYVSSILNSHCPGTTQCGETRLPCLSCSCDELCDLKNNCCPHIDQNKNQTDGEILGVSTFKCILPHLNINYDTPIQQNLGVYMVSTCMTGQDDQRCTNTNSTDLIDSLPYTCVKTGIHYRNYHCGICSGATEMLPWKPYVTCSNINVVKADTILFPNSVTATYEKVINWKDPTCGIEFRPPENITISQDLCYREPFNRTCDSNDVVIAEACDQLTIPYFHTEANETEVYANVFCFSCKNNGSISGNQMNVDLEIPHAENTFIAELNHENILKHDVKGLLQEVHGLVKQYTINPETCEEGQLYDPYNVSLLNICFNKQPNTFQYYLFFLFFI